ncbi:hypothetical protein JXB02_06785 [Candidatus Woesearchaeota archaeon]|nr:hypothetical protein [Candidatus Woesearchaeota archaeon]
MHERHRESIWTVIIVVALLLVLVAYFIRWYIDANGIVVKEAVFYGAVILMLIVITAIFLWKSHDMKRKETAVISKRRSATLSAVGYPGPDNGFSSHPRVAAAKAYIQNARAQGLSKEQIEQSFRRSGWSEEHIARLLGE